MSFAQYHQMRFLCPWCGARCSLARHTDLTPFSRIWVQCLHCPMLGMAVLLDHDDWKEDFMQAAMAVAHHLAEQGQAPADLRFYPTFEARDDLCFLAQKLLYEGDTVLNMPMADAQLRAQSDEHELFSCVLIAEAPPPPIVRPQTVYEHLLGDDS